jgi:hypothetical protein
MPRWQVKALSSLLDNDAWDCSERHLLLAYCVASLSIKFRLVKRELKACNHAISAYLRPREALGNAGLSGAGPPKVV